MAEGKVVLGLAIGSGYTRAAIATCGPSSSGDSGSGAPAPAPPSVVVNADGDRGTPTVVARRGEGPDEEWLVGEAAKAALAGRDSTVLSWAGEALMQGLKGEAEDEVEEGGAPGMEEVCARLLQHVLEQAEAFSGESPSDCVLAVPLSFSEEQRRAMIHTANMSGLNVTGVIREPTAALLAFKLANPGIPKPPQHGGPACVAVFDLGESHCDVSVVEDDQGLLRVVHTSSSGGIGGRALREGLVKLCLTDFRRKSGCDATESRRAMVKLRRECESAVKTLSTLQQADVAIDSLHEGCDLRLSVSRARFEGECLDVLRGALAAIDAALKEAGRTRDQVDLVLLAGGASRMPKLQQWVQGVFTQGTEVRSADVNPEEAVAIGAAIQAQLLARAASTPVLESHPVSTSLPCSPLTLGLVPSAASTDGTSPPKPIVLVPRGALLPAERVCQLAKLAPSQNSLHLRIVSSPKAAFASEQDCVAIGELMVDIADAGPTVELLMHVSEEGLVRLRVRNSESQLTVKEVHIKLGSSTT